LNWVYGHAIHSNREVLGSWYEARQF
jgi:hypothetical protein